MYFADELFVLVVDLFKGEGLLKAGGVFLVSMVFFHGLGVVNAGEGTVHYFAQSFAVVVAGNFALMLGHVAVGGLKQVGKGVFEHQQY